MSKKEKIDYLAFTRENDLPDKKRFGYRGLRIFGWVFMLCLVLGSIFGNNLALQLSKYSTGMLLGGVLTSFLGNLALPTFFIANFSIIISKRNNYKSLFTKYGIFIGIIFILLYGFLFRYFLMMGAKGNGSLEKGATTLTNLFNKNPTFGVVFNMFIDLMLCVLAWFFIDYTPRKHFKGKKIIYFRLLALIPIAYELICMVLKICSTVIPTFKFPFYVFPLLTNKPPILFFVFIAIAIREKLLERKYTKLGHTRAEFLEYCKTNAAAKTFSRFCSIIFIIAAVVDFIFYVITAEIIIQSGITTNLDFLNEIIRIGVGKGISLIFMVPIMHFYKYNKTYKTSSFDIILPIAATVIIALITIESIFEIVIGIL